MCRCRCRSVGQCRRPVILLFLPVHPHHTYILNSFANYSSINFFSIGWCRQPINFGISAHPPTPYMYFNSFANYFGINGLQTGTKCMLVCAGLIPGPLASADGQPFFISSCPPTPVMIGSICTCYRTFIFFFLLLFLSIRLRIHARYTWTITHINSYTRTDH